MADHNVPNDTLRTSRTEGERRGPDSENAGAKQPSGYETSDEDAAGITNRPLDEEMASQDAVPERGEARPGAHAGHGVKNRRS